MTLRNHGRWRHRPREQASEYLHWSQSPSAIMYSNDKGKTFTNIYDGRFGAVRWKGIAIDKNTGTLYGVTCGNGAFYATVKQQ